MVRISSFGAWVLGAASVAAQHKEFDQEASLRDSDCDNGCFFSSFPGGSCTDDAACMCNQQRYRERYFCCMAKKCLPHVVLDSIQRQWSGCEAHGVPIHYPEEFDFMGVCGVELSTTTTTMPSSSTLVSTSTSVAESSVESPSESSADMTRKAAPADANPTAAQASREIEVGSASGVPSSTPSQLASASTAGEEASESSNPGSGVGIVMPGLGAVALGFAVMML